MRMRRTDMVLLGMILLFPIIGVCFYPYIPEKLATHWNSQGQVNGYMSKFWGAFLMPLIFAGVILFLVAIPKIDPLKKNIEKFRKYYDGFLVLFLIFMLCLYMQVILWNIGIRITPNVLTPIGCGLLFFYIGILCPNAKRNWSIGIRTPWTMSSDNVWNKTHKIGGKLFKIAGAITVLGLFFQNFTTFFIVIPILLVAIYTIIYSYIEYRKDVS